MSRPPASLIFYRLSQVDQARLRNAADRAQVLENAWRAKAQRQISRYTEMTLAEIQRTGKLPNSFGFVDFYDLLVEHSFNVSIEAARLAESDLERHVDPSFKRLRIDRGTRLPSSLRELFKLWDLYRKGEYRPRRQRILADRLRKRFLDKVQDVYRKHSASFHSGEVADQERAVAKMRDIGRITGSRARMIVETETTYYYNQQRRAVYDQSPDVVGYLFLSVRDAATTKWCRSRSGLVYRRGDPLLDDETPPIHWRCRSEVLPLTRQSPSHRKLLDDPKLERRRHRCEPLPKGWKAR
jgi:SPP1 gp7 family putative phage head morphogenesis protein